MTLKLSDLPGQASYDVISQSMACLRLLNSMLQGGDPSTIQKTLIHEASPHMTLVLDALTKLSDLISHAGIALLQLSNACHSNL